jgi:hypothetical protein
MPPAAPLPRPPFHRNSCRVCVSPPIYVSLSAAFFERDNIVCPFLSLPTANKTTRPRHTGPKAPRAEREDLKKSAPLRKKLSVFLMASLSLPHSRCVFFGPRHSCCEVSRLRGNPPPAICAAAFTLRSLKPSAPHPPTPPCSSALFLAADTPKPRALPFCSALSLPPPVPRFSWRADLKQNTCTTHSASLSPPRFCALRCFPPRRNSCCAFTNGSAIPFGTFFLQRSKLVQERASLWSKLV